VEETTGNDLPQQLASLYGLTNSSLHAGPRHDVPPSVADSLRLMMMMMATLLGHVCGDAQEPHEVPVRELSVSMAPMHGWGTGCIESKDHQGSGEVNHQGLAR